MLNSYRKGALAIAAALSFSASAAQAEEHVVLIVDGSYFPSVVFASTGDTILFKNESTATHTVSGAEAVWTSEEIHPAGEFVLQLDESIPSTFSGTGGGFELANGEIVFENLAQN